jgi:hypothetical protein
MKAYYTLLIRESSDEPWSIDFGDYDRANVHAEADERIADGFQTMIFTSTARQRDIEAMVIAINSSI